MTMTTTSRLLKSTGPDALTKPNPNSGPILNLTGPSMDQLTKPQPSTWNTDCYLLPSSTSLTFVTNTTDISVETNIGHQYHRYQYQYHQYICGDKYEVCSSTSNRTVILMSFSFQV